MRLSVPFRAPTAAESACACGAILALALALTGCSAVSCWTGGIGEQPSRCGKPAQCVSDPGGCRVAEDAPQ